MNGQANPSTTWWVTEMAGNEHIQFGGSSLLCP